MKSIGKSQTGPVVQPPPSLLWFWRDKDDLGWARPAGSWLVEESRPSQGLELGVGRKPGQETLPLNFVLLFHPHRSASLLQKPISLPILGPMTFLSLNSRFPILVPGPQQRLPPSHRGPP